MTLPIISLEKLIAGDRDEITRLRDVTHEIGFFYLADHGIPEDLQAEMFSTAKEFFALPQEAKEEIAFTDNPHYRGYSRLGEEFTQGKLDWREQIDYGADRPAWTEGLDTHPWRVLEGPNPWPSALPRMKPLITDWQDRLSDVGLQLLRAWAQSLGQAADYFDDIFDHPHPMMKLAHYPAPANGEAGQGVGAHHDAGVLTLLLPEVGSGGLQVQRDGEWIDVAALPNLFIVNIGELLEAATDGYLPHPAPRPAVPARHRPVLHPVLPHPQPRRPLPAHHAPPGAGRRGPRPGARHGRTGDLRHLRAQHPEVPPAGPPGDDRPLPRGTRR